MADTERYVWHLSRRRYSDDGMTRQRVVKETSKTIVLHGPEWGWSSTREWRCMDKSECYAAFEDAKAALVSRREAAVTAAEDALHRARTALGSAKSMKEPTDA